MPGLTPRPPLRDGAKDAAAGVSFARPQRGYNPRASKSPGHPQPVRLEQV
jgi:hypothetical protein